MTSRSLASVGVLALLAALSASQSFNIALNDPLWSGSPGSEFPGGAGQTGYWNPVFAGGPRDPLTLQGLDGSATSVQMQATGASTSYGGYNNPNLTGDFKLLMESYAFIGLPVQYHFMGLQPGHYRIYTYAACTNGTTYAPLFVSVPGSTTPTQMVTGPMPANVFIYGIDYCMHEIDAATGAFEVDLTDNGPPNPEIHGFQIVYNPRPVSGFVNLQNHAGQVAGVPIVVKIRRPGSTFDIDSQSATLDANGNFAIYTAVPPGTYDIAIKASHWLRQNLPNQVLTDAGVSGLSYSLLNGDVNGDNAITLSDFGALRNAYGSHPGNGNWDPRADLNGDLNVGLSDFAILRANYGRDGDP